jgi:hypothetical protein
MCHAGTLRMRVPDSVLARAIEHRALIRFVLLAVGLVLAACQPGGDGDGGGGGGGDGY